jgi:hypothetical protein
VILLVFALITWLIICTLFVIPKSFSLTENIILFFLLVMGSIMISTILSLNLQYIQVNTRQSMFISYWLMRSVDIPLSLLICINLIYACKSRLGKAVITLVTLSTLMLIEILSVGSEVKAYLHWNIYYFLLTESFLLALHLYLVKWLKRII